MQVSILSGSKLQRKTPHWVTQEELRLSLMIHALNNMQARWHLEHEPSIAKLPEPPAVFSYLQCHLTLQILIL